MLDTHPDKNVERNASAQYTYLHTFMRDLLDWMKDLIMTLRTYFCNITTVTNAEGMAGREAEEKKLLFLYHQNH